MAMRAMLLNVVSGPGQSCSGNVVTERRAGAAAEDRKTAEV